MSNCVFCGVCYFDCDVKKKNENFVGFYVLVKVNCLILDNWDMVIKVCFEVLGKDK